MNPIQQPHSESDSMKTLKFAGYSDDTFGEYGATNDDYDNCASDQPIEYRVADWQSGMGVIVIGQHCPGNSGSWLIGVANWDPDHVNTDFPAWPMHFAPSDHKWNPTLVMEVPDTAEVTCLTRQKESE